MSGTIGTDPSITYSVVPSGGIISLTLASKLATGWSLTRYVDTGGVLSNPITVPIVAPTPPIVAGSFTQVVVLDVGDGTNAPLDPALSYAYTFTTSAGSVTTAAIPVAVTLEIVQDELTLILIRVLQSGLKSLAVPNLFKNKPSVFHAMPLTGQPTLPFVAVNQTNFSQSMVPIGQQNITNYQSNTATMPSMAKRRYNIAVITTTVEEREFYRDAIVSIFLTILGPLFNSIGQNVSHDFLVENSQVTADAMAPGFYYSEIMITVEGTFNTILTTAYGTIASIVPTPSTTMDPVGL